MGLFDFMKKKGIVIASPAEGECVPLSQVNDPTFSGEVLGKGVAIIPEKGMFWRVTQYDARFCRVKVEHDAADHLLESSKAEVEIKAVAAGSGYVDFSYGSGAEARTLRVYLTVL